VQLAGIGDRRVSALLVSSVGGHLAQLHRIVPRLGSIAAERTWVTFDTPQSRSLLEGEDVVFLDYMGPRDVKGALRHTSRAGRMLGRGHRFADVISTGSGIALSFLPLARARGARCHYIESFTRTDGPSLTGRILRRVPGMQLYSQYPAWAKPPWHYGGSVFDAFTAGARDAPHSHLRRVVVTLGTMEDYAFRRLVERVLTLLEPSTEVLWQVGCTDVRDLPIRAHAQIPSRDLAVAMEQADVVVAHAGCGSALAALEAGKMPVLVPRQAGRGENVDDHQSLLAVELERRGLAIVRSPETLTREDLLGAASCSTERTEPTSFELRR
jgi:UDP-N-acetylglucosamine transferase subunit ALG13